jgi:hypothetical protein
MSVAGQARYPDSILCRFLDRCLPLRAAVAEDWASRVASAPWTGIYLPDVESRQRIGVAAEMRIGLDLGETPAYSDLLSFLPPDEYSVLLSAAGFSPHENAMADGVTTDPLLFDWRRVHQPIGYDEDQHAALAACMEAAGMRNIWLSYIDRSVQTRRYILSQIRSSFAQARTEGAASTHDETGRDPAIDGLAHLWKGYLAHGRRALAGLDSRRVILAPELGGGYGIADFVVGRCLVEVKAAFDPVPSIGDWLNQVLAYALLDWSDALGIDTVAVYLGWQALLVSDSLARVLAAATPGSTPSLDSLRADFRTAMQVDIDESFATRMRQRYPPFVALAS